MDSKSAGPYSLTKLSTKANLSTFEPDRLSQDHFSAGLTAHSISYTDSVRGDYSLDIFRSMPHSKVSSKLMQQIISKAQPDELDTIIRLILPHISELMVDVYGNYICQTLFHNCSACHRLSILQALCCSLVQISSNPRGTHALQNLIAMLSLRDEEEIYQSALQSHIVSMSKDQNASHVIQRLLVTVHNRYFIIREIKEHVEELATDKLGVCVIKKCCNDPVIMSEVLGSALVLMQHPYGNYALQTVLDIWKEEAAHEFCSAVQGKVSQLCLQKYASNVIEKALKVENIRKWISREIMGNGKIEELMMSQYGSYVLRTAAENCEEEERREMMGVVKMGLEVGNNAKLKPIWIEIVGKLSRSSI
jgi:pumilio RNA-binding family